MALRVRTPWLGESRGYLSDWVTQLWVRATGRVVQRNNHSWLDGPAGDTREIGDRFFATYAAENGYTLTATPSGGLIPDFSQIAKGAVRPEITHFYEHTAQYSLDAWSEWSGVFRRFGWLLANLFSRRLRQLNMPLSSLDTSRGIASQILEFRDSSGRVRAAGWLRRLETTGAVLYAGLYGTTKPPGHAHPCVRVVFPLPNGSATVILRPEIALDGSLLLHSSGLRFGDAGFYFVVSKDKHKLWARYVRSMREVIHVYVDPGGELRTDHLLTIWRLPFLRLHYRMSRAAARSAGQSPEI
jgi:hypothetical protein